MNTDIRIKLSFPNHLKTKKLLKRLDYKGFYSLICLWCYIAQNKPDGDISNLQPEDIALAAQWDGDHYIFLNSLIEAGFIDESINPDGTIKRVLHDWNEHNAYAAHAKLRSEIARQNVMKRWQKRLKQQPSKTIDTSQSHTNSITTVLPNNTNGIPTEYQPDTPIPTPTPTPNPIPIPTPNSNSSKEELSSKLDVIPYEKIVSYLNEKTGKHFRNTTPETRKHIRARWREGFRLEEFYRVIDNMVTKWGKDPKMKDYLRPSTLFGTKFESYLNASPSFSDQGIMSTRIEKGIEVIKEWLEEVKHE